VVSGDVLTGSFLGLISREVVRVGGAGGERTNFGGGIGQAVESGALAGGGLPHEADERITTHCVASGVAKWQGRRGRFKEDCLRIFECFV
jgi:hypothetical protein